MRSPSISTPSSTVSDKLLAKHRVLPLFQRGKRLFLGVADPTNLHAIDEIKFQTGLRVEPIVVEDDKLQKLLDKAIEQVDTSMPNLGDDDGVDLEALEVTGGDDETRRRQCRATTSKTRRSSASSTRCCSMPSAAAPRTSISSPTKRSIRVRFRIDGVLKEIAQPPVQLAGKMSARLKVMSRLDIAERRVPQDGRIKMKLSKTRAIDFRVSTCPTLFGEKIVLRILDPSQAMLGIDALGYEPFQKELYLKYLAKPQGMILVTGPTGSGKTVSLYTGLQHPQQRRHQHLDRGGPGGNQPARRQPGQRQQQGGPDLRRRAARLPAPGSGRHHGRRNPRPRNRRNRHQGRADRPPGAVDAAHQRRAADADAPGRHGREALRHRDLGAA